MNFNIVSLGADGLIIILIFVIFILYIQSKDFVEKEIKKIHDSNAKNSEKMGFISLEIKNSFELLKQELNILDGKIDKETDQIKSIIEKIDNNVKKLDIEYDLKVEDNE